MAKQDPMAHQLAFEGAINLLRFTLPRCNNGSCQRVATWYKSEPFYVACCDECYKVSPYMGHMRSTAYAVSFRELAGAR